VAQALLDDPQLFEPKASLQDGVARLVALPGIGEWTAQYIAMRQLREADAFASGDIGLINALAALEGGPVSARQLLARADAWRPLEGVCGAAFVDNPVGASLILRKTCGEGACSRCGAGFPR
jgi:3-methyladenine DNA glycosylase/8-oxoguanine DNA glycosylase